MAENQPQELEIPKEEIKYYYTVVLLEDGKCLVEQCDSEDNAKRYASEKVLSCKEKHINIIDIHICPSNDPEWTIKFLKAHEERLMLAKNDLLKLKLSSKIQAEKMLRTRKNLQIPTNAKTVHSNNSKNIF